MDGPSPSLRSLALLLVLALLACAGEAPVAAARPLCGEETRFVSWAEAGLPADAMPLDLALAGESVWVVFDPPLLARLARDGGGKATVLPVAAEEGEVWNAVDADPADGTLWLARGDGDELVRVKPGSGAVLRLPLESFGGGGGLLDVRTGAPGLAVSPYCAEHGLWTVSRTGEPLGTAFPAGESDPHADLREPRFGCPRALLDRLPDGEVVAFALADRRLHRWRRGGAWDAGPAAELGEEAAGSVSALFHDGGVPVLLGAAPTGPGDRPLGTLLHRLDPGGGEAQAVLERCDGRVLVAVEADAAGAAALAPGGLFLIPPPLAPPAAGR